MSNGKVPKDYDHHKETQWQEKWQKDQLYRFNPEESRPRYIIDTPPPYPTGSIHMGHVLNWLYMDLIARYQRMKGCEVLFPQGWDCHGLPTEVKVEEIHHIKKNDVPREEFRQMCIDLTGENIAGMKAQMMRLGFSQDWTREYVTMTPEYQAKTQLSFLKMYHEGLIYRAVHPVNWCPRCETAIAFAEVEYHENQTHLNYLRFKDGQGEEGVEIATTRPELLAACVAVVVHPEDERYQALAGNTVTIPLFNREVRIIQDEEVDPEFGTGAVMICTFGDKTDVSWVNRYDLDIIEALDEKGFMTEACGDYVGLQINECKKKIVEDLEEGGHLTRQEEMDQNVGQCWRCKTPIEILVKKQWFVAANQLSSEITQAAEEIDWTPEHMKIRLLNWTGSMDWDWCISRQRIFATPIPIWYCTDCGEVKLPREEDLPVDPTQTKPQEPCQCGSTSFRAEEDVLDTWMDSSITPLVIAGWPDPSFMSLYPSSIRQQGHDIIRTWAFYTIMRCHALTGESPFQAAVINGMVFGDDGHKMSKSRGNVIAPEEVIEEYGADALRLWAANSVPGSDVPFAWKDVQHSYKFLRKFWNAFRFASMNLEGYTPTHTVPELGLLDHWILSQLNRLVGEVTAAMDTYNFALARNRIQSFIWHQFCDDYIEAVKYRLYSQEKASREAALYTLHTVISTSLKLLAPFTPHFSEEIHQYLQEGTVHRERWPDILGELIDLEAERQAQMGVQVIGELRRFKSSQGLPLNTPLQRVTIYTSQEEVKTDLNPSYADIEGTIRIQDLKVEVGPPEVQEVLVEVTPRMDRVGPHFKKDAPKIVAYLQSQEPQQLGEILETEGQLEVDDLILTPDFLQTRKDVVGKTGEKVHIIQVEELDLVVEIQV
ncbi:MAG: valine--tRNA ligase [Methanobacteriaceae archaeon]|nr:valine--tRNA ligase [Methanobacteriaceae archaeon]